MAVTTDDIIPIPTVWEGVTYRSRTEARWAIFFGGLPIAADYEAEPFRLPSGMYLPDFHIPEWKMFIEIKGCEPTPLELQKCLELARATGHSVLLADGAPSSRFYRFFASPDRLDEKLWGRIERCRRCRGFVIEMRWDRAGNDWGGVDFVGTHTGTRCEERGGIGVPGEAIGKASDERFGVYPKS